MPVKSTEQQASLCLHRIRQGIGEITATAMVTSEGDTKQFRSGRRFSARLGLTPRQRGTGGKIQLGRITKQSAEVCLTEYPIRPINE